MQKIFFAAKILILLGAPVASVQAATHNIHIEWTYDQTLAVGLSGFRLYKEDIAVCHTANPEDRSMDCVFESPYGTFNFYLAAYTANSSSALSLPFQFKLIEPEPVPPPPPSQIDTTQTPPDTLPSTEPDPENSETESITYSLPDTDESAVNGDLGEAATHALPANTVSDSPVTVTDDSEDDNQASMSSITFLKGVNISCTHHINALLLTKKNN